MVLLEYPAIYYKYDIKLFDFGLARFCPGGHGDAFRMSVAGTPRYMAPECLR